MGNRPLQNIVRRHSSNGNGQSSLAQMDMFSTSAPPATSSPERKALTTVPSPSRSTKAMIDTVFNQVLSDGVSVDAGAPIKLEDNNTFIMVDSEYDAEKEEEEENKKLEALYAEEQAEKARLEKEFEERERQRQAAAEEAEMP